MRGAVAIGAAALVAIACSDETRSHVYAGRTYDEAHGCLDDVTSVDVVDGPQPDAPCAPTCVVSPPDFDSGLTTVYVSTMCAPYPPPPFDTSGADPRCRAALALYAENATCLADGGVAIYGDAGILDGSADASVQDAGNSVQDASMQDASMQDASMQDASMQDASMQAPSDATLGGDAGDE